MNDTAAALQFWLRNGMFDGASCRKEGPEPERLQNSKKRLMQRLSESLSIIFILVANGL